VPTLCPGCKGWRRRVSRKERHFPKGLGLSDIPTIDPVPAPRCSSTTKAGKPCGGYAVEGGSTCVAHTPHIAAVARSKGVERSREVRKQRVEQREQADELAKLSLTQLLRKLAHERKAEIVKSLLDAAIADGSSAAMRETWQRIEGKVIDVTQVNAGDPFNMSQTELEEYLRKLDQRDAEAPSESW
jgi:hypothetical protein